MDLPIEKWLANQPFGTEPASLLKEAVVCFKAGAYRAALILSYLSLQTAVRERLLAAKVPSGFTQGAWDDLHKRLRDEDRWDSTVYDAIQNQKTPMFVLTEDLRGQVQFWKNRRNDCAHSKQNTIGSPYVEAFWLFMQSNMPKFVVNGSRQALLEKIERHYDPTFTPKGKDPTPIVAEIPAAISNKELGGFFRDVNDLTKNLSSSVTDADIVSLLDAMLRFSDDTLREAAIEFVSSEHQLFVQLVRAHPEHLVRFSAKSQLLHKLWYVDLFNGYPDWPVYDALLRNGLIDDDELATAATRIVSRLAGVEPADEYVDRLKTSGFFDALEDYAFVKRKIDRFGWGNPNADLIRWYLERFPLSVESVEGICSAFSSDPCAHGPRDALQQLFSQNESKRKEFLTIAQNNDLQLPKLVPALAKEEDEDEDDESKEEES